MKTASHTPSLNAVPMENQAGEVAARKSREYKENGARKSFFAFFCGSIVFGRCGLSSLTVILALLLTDDGQAANTHAATLVRSSNQYFSAPDSPSLSITGDLTVEAWIKLSSQLPNHSYTIASKFTEAGSQQSFWFRYLEFPAGSGNKILDALISANGVMGVQVSVPAVLSVGEWTHVAMVYISSAGELRFYVNGFQAGATQTVPTSIFDSTAPFLIGGYENGVSTTLFDGQIDEVRLWATARTSNQISGAMFSELIGTEPNLRGYWKLNNSVADSTGNGNTLVNHNGATFGSANLAFLGACNPMISEYLAWWPGEGNANDVRGTNSGTLMNGVTFAAGKVGQAFSFNGANSYVRLPDNLFPYPTLGSNGHEPFSFETWFKTTSGGVILGQQSVDPTNNVTGHTSGLYVGTDGRLRVEMFYSGPLNPVEAMSNVSDGIFHHVCVAYDGTNLRLYLDGVLAATRAQAQIGYQTLYKYQLGTGSTAGRPGGNNDWFSFNGLIDEPSLYSRALSAAEVQAIHAAGSVGKCTFDAQTCVPKPAGLAAWWPGDGNANDARGTNNGTLMNGTTFAAGKLVGQSLSFDGVDDYFVVPDSEAQRPTNITIEGWFKVLQAPVIGQDFILAAKYGGGWNGWTLLLFETLNPRFRLNRQSDQTTADAISSVSIPVGQWTHLAGTYDGTNGKIYVNGALRGSVSFPGGYTPTSTPMTVGKASHYDGAFVPEQVDEFSIYTRALTETEINSIYAAGNAGSCTDTDGDGMPDEWEIQHSLNPLAHDANGDLDLDGVSNLQEYQNRADGYRPDRADSLGNNRSDYERLFGTQTNHFYYDRNDRLVGADYNHGSNGFAIGFVYDGNGNLLRQKNLARDANHNRLPDLWEFLQGLANNTSTYADTDGDDWTDFQEWQAGTSPTNFASRPGLLDNPGLNIASLTLPFTPSNFVVGVGQLDGGGAEEIVLGADGDPGTNTNFLLVLTQVGSTWSTQRVDVGAFGITSLAVGQPSNRPNAGIYVGLRGPTNGSGKIVEFTKTGAVWLTSVAATSTNNAGFVLGLRDADLLGTVAVTNLPDSAVFSIAYGASAWSQTIESTNASHRGLGIVASGVSNSATLLRTLDIGGIETSGLNVTRPATVPTNLAFRGVATQSPNNPTHPATNAIDGNLSNFTHTDPYVAGGSYPSWTLDLQALCFVDVVEIFNRTDCCPERLHNYTVSLFGSHGTSAQPVFSQTYATGPTPPASQTISLSGLVARFIRVELQPPFDAVSYLSLGEVRVTGVVGANIKTNAVTFNEPSGTNKLLWRGHSLASGGLNFKAALLYTYVEDGSGGGRVNDEDEFVVAEYTAGNTNAVAVTRSRIGSTAGPAQSYGVTSANWLNQSNEVYFTGEPDGQVFSWSATGSTNPLQRQLFSGQYTGQGWHAMTAVKTFEVGEGLAGLLVDPATPNQCEVILWPPQAQLPQAASFPQTAPLARVLPNPANGTNMANVTVRLWDAEGNASLPLLQFSPNTTNWFDVTNILTVDGLPYSLATRVSALPGGSTHTLVWNARAVFPPGITNIFLRTRAKDITLLGDWSEPMPYQLNITLDQDNDDLPDSWEISAFGNINAQNGDGDADGDGFKNSYEYLAGTNPTNAASSLRITLVQPVQAGLRIDWMSGTSGVQVLQGQPGFGTNWVNLFSIPSGLSSTQTFTVTNLPPAGNLDVFRIRLAP